MMAVSKTVNYEYMNESQIDEELKCPICKQPFQLPVSLSVCQHTFCEECIIKWLGQMDTCPTCRKCTNEVVRRGFGRSRSFREPVFAPINTRIVLNQLDRLMVQCALCQKTNIQRCHFAEHEQHCTMRRVSCTSADIQCSWTGLKDQLDSHLNTCVFQQVRPIVDKLQKEVKVATEKQAKLEESVKVLERQMDFLLAFINKGHPMVQQCTKSLRECRYATGAPTNTDARFLCRVCAQLVPRYQVVLHACSGDCICRQCITNEYSNDHNGSRNGHDIFSATEESWD